MEYLTIPQLAEMLGLSRVTVYRKVKSGEIHAIKVGRNYVIRYKDVADILGRELNEKAKKSIRNAVSKTIREYDEVLKKLGKE